MVEWKGGGLVLVLPEKGFVGTRSGEWKGGGLVLVLPEKASSNQDKHKASTPLRPTSCPYAGGKSGSLT